MTKPGEPWLSALLRRETAAARLAGCYGPMLVAVDGREVRGAFSEQRVGIGTEELPQFTCRFTFAGRLRGGGARVVSRVLDGEAIRGQVGFEGDVMRLKLDADQPGCAMTSGSMANVPFEARRDGSGEGWSDVGLMTARVARLRAGPRPGPVAGRPWLVEGDAVAVLARAGQWLRVRYAASGKPAEGWVRADELALPAAASRR